MCGGGSPPEPSTKYIALCGRFVTQELVIDFVTVRGEQGVRLVRGRLGVAGIPR
jgi:hypothetical protein